MNDKQLKYRYLGPLYVGEDLSNFWVIYDTMSDFIAIDNKYDISQSNTSKPWSDPDGTQKK